MAEYISCRNCDSAYCDGCNIYTLATMLQEGKFDCLMDENCSVNRFVDVAPVVRCRECKWWDDSHCTNINGAFCVVENGDWFCASGERKDNA